MAASITTTTTNNGNNNGSSSSADSSIASNSNANSSASSSNTASEAALSKAAFYEMMAKLLTAQLENCDPKTPLHSLWAPPVAALEQSASFLPHLEAESKAEGTAATDSLNPTASSAVAASLPSLSCSSYPRLRNSAGKPYMLQPSLFPLHPPTVYFAPDDDGVSPVPNEIRSFLRWKLTTITANTMKAIVQRSGYRLVALDKNNRAKSFSNWNAIWCKHLKVTEFSLVGYHQRINHFPGSFNFGRKDRLWINLKAKAERYGHEVFGNFHPRTFILPADYSQLVEYWSEEASEKGPGAGGDQQQLRHQQQQQQHSRSAAAQFGRHKKVFICKPPASARGQGISIVSTVEELNQLMITTANQPPQQPSSASGIGSGMTDPTTNKTTVGGNGKKPKVHLVAQEYISNPCLLANSAKFDLRVYVLLTSISPLRLYVYEEGLVRFASNRYSTRLEDITNQFIHLTNYSVNKNCVEYVASSGADSQDGHKWTLKSLWRYMAAAGIGDPARLWAAIIDLVVKTVISAESQILALLKTQLKNRRSCFELLGFDIMLDEALKLWLLEVNITPSLRADSPLDYSVKNQLVKDILNTIGYQLSPRFRKHYNFGAALSPEKADYLNEMKVANEEKHRKYETQYLEGGFTACQDMIEALNEDDLYQLMESEDELQRAGQFRRVFPVRETARAYLPFFDFPYYYNLLLINWEERYGGGGDRGEGIARIRAEMMKRPQVAECYSKLKSQLENERTFRN